MNNFMNFMGYFTPTRLYINIQPNDDKNFFQLDKTFLTQEIGIKNFQDHNPLVAEYSRAMKTKWLATKHIERLEKIDRQDQKSISQLIAVAAATMFVFRNSLGRFHYPAIYTACVFSAFAAIIYIETQPRLIEAYRSEIRESDQKINDLKERLVITIEKTVQIGLELDKKMAECQKIIQTEELNQALMDKMTACYQKSELERAKVDVILADLALIKEQQKMSDLSYNLSYTSTNAH